MVANIAQIKEAAIQYVARVKTEYPLVRAVLYGSYARGDAREWSDIDICLFVSYYTKDVPRYKTLGRLLRMGDEFLRPEWNTYFEPRLYHVDEIQRGNPFVDEIIRTGIEIPVPDEPVVEAPTELKSDAG